MRLARFLCAALPAAALLAGCATSKPAPARANPGATAEASKPAAPAARKKPATPGLVVYADEVLAPVNRNVLSGFNYATANIVDFMEDLQAVKAGQLRVGGESYDRNDLSEAVLGNIKANVLILRSQEGEGAVPGAVVQTRVGWLGTQGGEPRNQPEDAANAVRWAKAMGLKVDYWEIGNEPDLYGAKQSAPDYTPQKYCATFRAQAAAMKAVDPAVKVAGPVVSGAKPARDTFLEQFVKDCGDVVDVLTWHIYPTDGGADDDLAFSTAAEADQTVDAYRALWADKRANPKGWQRPIELGVTEYGLSWQSGRARHLSDMPAAMWTLETALRLNEKGVGSAHYFSIQGMQNHGLVDQSGARRPVWYAFITLSKLSGNLVAAATGDDDVWAHAARAGDRLDVVLVNKATAPKTLPVAVPGFTLRHAAYFDDAVTKDERPVEPLAVAAAVTLPPRSVVHLAYGQGDAVVADPYARPAAAAPAPAAEKPAKAVKAKAKKAGKKPTRK
ncbi:MAG TPA: hypothetical protein VEB43_06080 [Anaeromyxobacter sp.]|nr:hypothetical protein [Anaeromyxobacter sp.]